MKTAPGTLSVWVGQRAACVKVTGRATFAQAVDFRRLLRHLAEAGHARIALELSGCQTMDSTFLGVLAHEANQRLVATEAGTEPGLELWNPGERVRELVNDLGVGRLFKFVERENVEAQFSPAPVTPAASREELTRACLDAHELLMALHPDNVAKFKDVARYFAEELKKTKA